MLNRDICRKCINFKYIWHSSEERTWKEEFCESPYETKKIFNTTNCPPNDCPYLLEHIVSANDK